MHRKFLAVIVAVIVAAVAIASVAFGPAALRNLSNPESNQPGNGGGPLPTAFDAPTWHQGDSWTYDVNTSSRLMEPDGPSAVGSLTRTVVSAVDTVRPAGVRVHFGAGGGLLPSHGDAGIRAGSA